MSNNLEKAFREFDEDKSINSLRSNILLRIDEIKIRKIKNRSLLVRFVGGLSFVSLIPIFINFVGQIQNSGFWSYLSLLFTDTGVVMIYWRQFSLSLIETVPVFQLTLILVAFLGLSFSFKFGFSKKDIQKIGLSANFI